MAAAACRLLSFSKRTASPTCTTSPVAWMPGRGRVVRRLRCTETMRAPKILILALLGASQPAAAEDLMQVFRDSQRYDAPYPAAHSALSAGRERLPQGRALLLPTLNLAANATRSRIDLESREPTL